MAVFTKYIYVWYIQKYSERGTKHIEKRNKKSGARHLLDKESESVVLQNNIKETTKKKAGEAHNREESRAHAGGNTYSKYHTRCAHAGSCSINQPQKTTGQSNQIHFLLRTAFAPLKPPETDANNTWGRGRE